MRLLPFSRLACFCLARPAFLFPFDVQPNDNTAAPHPRRLPPPRPLQSAATPVSVPRMLPGSFFLSLFCLPGGFEPFHHPPVGFVKGSRSALTYHPAALCSTTTCSFHLPPPHMGTTFRFQQSSTPLPFPPNPPHGQHPDRS